ncbi:isocitrate lyase/PEP mutase family protein [Pseudomonas sp. B392_1p]|uniref:isocitrate lyase/PEP mutase family protein n=1 Tax=Pseudomonas sp. B392_1p TaxID=3457507 RepID=UPI003FD67943
MATQAQRAETFRALEQRKQLLVLPNPWDAGSARILASLGFEALASSNAGLAFSLGRCDGEGRISRQEALANARAIVEATDLPVAADLENGYGDTPEDCALTIEHAAQVGLIGASIEDASGNPLAPIYPFELAVERIHAAAQAARSLDFPFSLCARAENYLHGRPDLDDTVRRLQAFAAAGADVLYAPGLTHRQQIIAVVQAVAPKPVTVMVGIAGLQLSLVGLAEVGVRRVCLGSSLARVAYGSFYQAAGELARRGSLHITRQAISLERLNDLLRY